MQRRVRNLAGLLNFWRDFVTRQPAAQMSVTTTSEVNTDLPVNKKRKMDPIETTTLQFAKLTENAFAPTRESKLAAGYDLYR